MTSEAAKSQSRWFVWLFALAWAGGSMAYTPLLTILLPGQVARTAGSDLGVAWLAEIALIGAIAASVGNIACGYLSDITGTRRPWVAAGMVISCLLLPRIGLARDLSQILILIVCWQLGLNMMLGPLSAWAGDLVPDDQKGLLGGLMAIAPGAGAFSGALVTHPGLIGEDDRLIVVALLVAMCVVPVLLFAPRGTGVKSEDKQADLPRDVTRRRVTLMWFARLAVQIAEATLFAFLLFWLRDLDPQIGENQIARLFSTIMVLSIPLALLTGRWSDRSGKPISPLIVCAAISAIGLLGMAAAPSVMSAMFAYGLFGLATAVFLSLHSSQTLRVLPRPSRRGRDLGLFNLTNTVPSLIMPGLAIGLIPVFGFRILFLLLAALAIAAATLLTALIRTSR